MVNSLSKRLVLLAIAASFCACASVPRESVELSQTIGQDLEVMHRSHKDLARVLFGRMKDDVNSFVDDVYRPYQMQELLKDEFAYFRADEPSLFGAIEQFKQDTAHQDAAKIAVEMMAAFTTVLNEIVEEYRSELLTPIVAQEAEVLRRIDQSYESARYANSVVTGHLSSVHKVNVSRENTLASFGLAGISQGFSTRLATVSNSIQGLVSTARSSEMNMSNMQSVFSNLSSGVRGAAESLLSDE